MIVYRITNFRALDGKGAAKQLNNRWNGLGTKMLYCAGSIAVAKGELSRRAPLHLLPAGFEILSIEIPESLIFMNPPLPEDWDDVPPNVRTKMLGDLFVKEKKYLAMRVTSAYDKQSDNFIINPDHPSFDKVKLLSTEPLYV